MGWCLYFYIFTIDKYEKKSRFLFYYSIFIIIIYTLRILDRVQKKLNL